MANVDRYAPGSFCWFELATSDQHAAKQFYGRLFGWGAADMPMGPGDFYTMFKLEGRDTGAAYTLKPEQKQLGIPPHWAIYITVADADQSAAKVGPAGGQGFWLNRSTCSTWAAWPRDGPRRRRFLPVAGANDMPEWESRACRARSAGPTSAPRTWNRRRGSTRQYSAGRSRRANTTLRLSPHQERRNFHRRHPARGHQTANVPPHWMLYFYVPTSPIPPLRSRKWAAQVLRGADGASRSRHMSVVADPKAPPSPSSPRSEIRANCNSVRFKIGGASSVLQSGTNFLVRDSPGAGDAGSVG